MHLGVTPWRGMTDGAAEPLCAQAVRAEALGFDSFWLPENHLAPTATGEQSVTPAASAMPEPLMLLAAIASRTQRLRLATTSFLLPVRHPLQAAEQVAVLDRLSSGRVTLGVGRGWQPAMFTAFAVDSHAKRRLFETALDAMRRAWRGEPVCEGQMLSPLPLQCPHPPLWVAAFGPKALEQAGRLSLPYLASPVEPIAAIAANLERWRAAADAALVAPPAERPVMRTVFVSSDSRRLSRVRAALAEQAATMARGPGPAPRRLAANAALEDWAIVAEPAAVADTMARYRETLGTTHLIVARPRLPHLPEAWLEDSLVRLAEARVNA